MLKNMDSVIDNVISEIVQKDQTIRDIMIPLDVQTKAFLIAGVSLKESETCAYNNQRNPFHVLQQKISNHFKEVYDPLSPELQNPGEKFYSQMVDNGIELTLGLRLPSCIYDDGETSQVVVPFITRYGYSLAYREGALTAEEIIGPIGDYAPLQAEALTTFQFVEMLKNKELKPSLEPNERNAWLGYTNGAFFPSDNLAIGPGHTLPNGKLALFEWPKVKLPLMSVMCSSRFIDNCLILNRVEIHHMQGRPYWTPDYTVDWYNISRKLKTLDRRPSPIQIFFWCLLKEVLIPFFNTNDPNKNPEAAEYTHQQSVKHRNDWVKMILGQPLSEPTPIGAKRFTSFVDHYAPFIHLEDRLKHILLHHHDAFMRLGWPSVQQNMVVKAGKNLPYNSSVMCFNSFKSNDPFIIALIKDYLDYGFLAPFDIHPYSPQLTEELKVYGPEKIIKFSLDKYPGVEMEISFPCKIKWIELVESTQVALTARNEQFNYYKDLSSKIPSIIRNGLCPYRCLGADSLQFKAEEPEIPSSYLYYNTTINRAFLKETQYHRDIRIAYLDCEPKPMFFRPGRGFTPLEIRPISENEWKKIVSTQNIYNVVEDPKKIFYTPGILGVPFPPALTRPLPKGLEISQISHGTAYYKEGYRGDAFTGFYGEHLFTYLDFYYDSDLATGRDHDGTSSPKGATDSNRTWGESAALIGRRSEIQMDIRRKRDKFLAEMKAKGQEIYVRTYSSSSDEDFLEDVPDEFIPSCLRPAIPRLR